MPNHKSSSTLTKLVHKFMKFLSPTIITNIPRNNIEALIMRLGKNRNNEVCFVKRSNGAIRRMRFQYGVAHNLKGVGPKYDYSEKHLICVWDIQKHEYRSINLDTVKWIKQGRHIWSVTA